MCVWGGVFCELSFTHVLMSFTLVYLKMSSISRNNKERGHKSLRLLSLSGVSLLKTQSCYIISVLISCAMRVGGAKICLALSHCLQAEWYLTQIIVFIYASCFLIFCHSVTSCSLDKSNDNSLMLLLMTKHC